MMLVLVAVAVAQLTAAVQAKPATIPNAATPAISATGRISGTVQSAVDDAPLARARVVATSPALPQPRVTLTGADGKYAIDDLPAGAYTVSATRTGYAPFTYGQGRAVGGTPVIMTSGQRIADLDLALAPGGVIAGRIFDEDGSPFAGANVDALVSRSQNGTDVLVSVASAQTDDRGEFRLFGLAPGSYYISATDPAFANISTAKGVQHYSATYYPGTPLADQARRVAVAAGELPRVEFKLQLVPPARIAGRLLPYDFRPLLNGAIIMTPMEGEVPMTVPQTPELFPDGRFSFGGVAPGRYQIRARGQTDPAAAALFAVYSIEVSGHDVDAIQMTLRPGGTIAGTLAVESAHGRKGPELATLRVRAPFIDGTAFGDSLSGSVQANGRYSLRGVMKGTHQIVVDGLEAPWVLKSVQYRGSDITDLQLPIDERQELRDVRVVISDGGGEVSGLVENARQRPVANTGVLVCSSVPVFWMHTSRRVRVTFTDQQGRWHVTGLPPGEYFAVAAPMIDQSELGRRNQLEALQALGTAFRLDGEDARATLRLQISSVPRPAGVR